MDWYRYGGNCSKENSTFAISKIETSSESARWCVFHPKWTFVSKLFPDHMRFGRCRNHKIKNWKNFEPRRTKISYLSYLRMRPRYVIIFSGIKTHPKLRMLFPASTKLYMYRLYMSKHIFKRKSSVWIVAEKNNFSSCLGFDVLFRSDEFKQNL